eukprot:SM000090S24351  [mRNA]  locus=s90:467746:469512:+ [translate_table: standard]
MSARALLLRAIRRAPSSAVAARGCTSCRPLGSHAEDALQSTTSARTSTVHGTLQLQRTAAPLSGLFIRRRSLASAASFNVLQVKTDSEFAAALEAAKDKLAVVDFTAKWCGPCRTIAPAFELLSNELDHVTFVKADIDEEGLQKTVAEAGISAVPTFHFYKTSTKIGEFSGADVKKLKDMVTVLRQK